MTYKCRFTASVFMLSVLAACGGGKTSTGTSDLSNSATAPDDASQRSAQAVRVTQAPSVIINEVMAANFAGAPDEDGDREDWAELYNTTAAAVDLSGYGLSNKPGSPFRWVFPVNTSLPAKGYLRVWLSKKNRTTNRASLHTDFNLDNGADDILLSAPNGTTLGTLVDTVPVALTRHDVSLCRLPNGVAGATVAHCAGPTPGAANTGASATTMLSTPAISLPSGLYPAAQAVTLVGPAGATLRYTLDGSEPTATSAIYTAPISITKSAALRVAAFQTGFAQSRSETASYFIGNHAAMAGQRVLFVNMSPTDAATYRAGGRTTVGWSSHVELISGAGTTLFKGNAAASDSGQIGSRNGQNNVPMDIKFKDALGVKSVTASLFPTKPGTTSFKHLKVRNGGDDYWYAHLRDQFWQSLLDEKVAPGAASVATHMVVNGQYVGMLDLREKEDETLIESTYGVDKDSVDYINDTKVLSGLQAWNEYLTFRNFMLVTDLSIPTNYGVAKTKMDMENFAQDFALHMFAVDRDWLWRNMHFFRMPAYDGKWRYRPHDFDISADGINAWGFPITTAQNMNDYYGRYDAGLFMNRLLVNPEFKDLYINVIADQMNGSLSPSATNSRLDAMAADLQPYLPSHYAAFANAGSMSTWNTHITRLRGFLNNRAASYDLHTQQKFTLTARKSLVVSVNDPAMGTIKVNTIDLSKALATTPNWTGRYYPQVPVTLEARPAPGFVFVGWEGASTAATARIQQVVAADNTTLRAIFAVAANVTAPAITATPSMSNLTGDTVAYRVQAADAQQYPLTFSAKKLPSGLTIHPETGMISGSPSKGGTFATTITVSNGKSASTLSVPWTVANRGDRLVTLPQAVTGDGNGLTGSYYNNATLTGAPALIRTEVPTVNLGAGAGPVTGFGTSNWSIRWDGYVEAPAAGVYNLQALTNTDDGVRVYVGGTLVIDNWTQPSTVAKQAANVTLPANTRTPIRIEYLDASGAAKLQLNWKRPGATAYETMAQGVFNTTP